MKRKRKAKPLRRNKKKNAPRSKIKVLEKNSRGPKNELVQ